ncbi:MAG: hypothetical protein KAT28_05775 [Candidatus Aenigmarchaeota archaeon]|nr:hypothetical protein [Candidatus Aenigmarchaeota archaeon]
MPDKKEIKRSFIFHKDLIAGSKSYDEITNPIYNEICKISEKDRNYFYKFEDSSISLGKKLTLFPKLINCIKTGKKYQEVFFMQTYSQLEDLSSKFSLPNEFNYDDFSERTDEFRKLCGKSTGVVYETDGLLVCADMKDTYGKELSDLVKNEINDLGIKFVEKFVNGIYIFLPKGYTK